MSAPRGSPRTARSSPDLLRRPPPLVVAPPRSPSFRHSPQSPLRKAFAPPASPAHLVFMSSEAGTPRGRKGSSPSSPGVAASPKIERRTSANVHPGSHLVVVDDSKQRDLSPPSTSKTVGHRRKSSTAASVAEVDTTADSSSPSMWALRKTFLQRLASAERRGSWGKLVGAQEGGADTPSPSSAASSAAAAASGTPKSTGKQLLIKFPRKLVVDKDFVATAVVLVPDSVGEVDAADLVAFKARFERGQFVDIGLAEFYLGVVLHVFYDDLTEFNGKLKWVFLTDNELNKKLIMLLASFCKDLTSSGHHWCELVEREGRLDFRLRP